MRDSAPPLFVYGTLRDHEILSGVLARVPAIADILPGQVRGWRTAYYPGELYPALVAEPGRLVEGLVIFGLGSPDMERLDTFEGEQYRRGDIEVQTDGGMLVAQVYFPTMTIDQDAPDWTLEDWTNRHRPRLIAQYRRRYFR